MKAVSEMHKLREYTFKEPVCEVSWKTASGQDPHSFLMGGWGGGAAEQQMWEGGSTVGQREKSSCGELSERPQPITGSSAMGQGVVKGFGVSLNRGKLVPFAFAPCFPLH